MITNIILTIQLLFSSGLDTGPLVTEDPTGITDEAPCFGAACSSEFCCGTCRTVFGITTCWDCTSGPACEGQVLSCVGCYTGESSCAFGGATNTCCD